MSVTAAPPQAPAATTPPAPPQQIAVPFSPVVAHQRGRELVFRLPQPK
jgi:hypothetical protein